MSPTSRSSVLPLVLIVASLSVLSILAPSAWRSMTRTTPRPPAAEANVKVAAAPAPVPIETVLVEPATAEKLAKKSGIPADQVESDVFDEIADLGEYAAEPHVVEPAPPVAEKIDLDPSVSEIPALPAAVPDNPAPVAPPVVAAPANEAAAEPTTPAPTDNEPTVPTSESGDAYVDTASPPESVSPWPQAHSLLAEFDALPSAPAIDEWREQIRAALVRLHATTHLAEENAKAAIDELEELAGSAESIAARMTTSADRAAVLRTAYSMSRRLEIWRRVNAIAAQERVRQVSIVDNTETVARMLAEADHQLHGLQQARAWREYLLLGEARALARLDGSADEQRQVARRMLMRMDSPLLTAHQQAFFEQQVFQDLARELRVWADEPVDYAAMLAALERYEQSGSTLDARDVAEAYQVLRWAPGEPVADLAEHVNAHYRNANLRVALSAALINRLLPNPNDLHEPVEDNIQGADVYGRSRISTRLRSVLVPDEDEWRVGIEAYGMVDSETESYSGPAVFYNEGQLQYWARKLLLIDRGGIKQFKAEAEAEADNTLTGMETDYDAIPLLNLFARSYARQQYDSQHNNAKWEVEQKAARKASQRLDAEVRRRLAVAEEAVEKEVFKPLRDLELNPIAVDMQTTEERLLVRYRLAGRDQLGGNTPRPQAPNDSLLSVQIHQTALNNTIEKLNLDGRRIELRELFAELSQAFDRKKVAIPEDVPENVVVQFAEHDSVRAEFIDGRVRLTIRLAELSKNGGSQWTNFAVRAYYKPATLQRNANLVRDGIIELPARLGTFERVALLGIFNKVLSRDHTFNIINKSLAESPKLRDLQVTQFVIRDGWIGVALGPQRGPSQADVQRYAGGHLDDEVR